MVDHPVVLGRVSRRIVIAASAPRNLAVLANGWYGAAWSALELADGPAWDESVAAFTTIADELRLPHESALAATMATTTALIEGNYADAERHHNVRSSLGPRWVTPTHRQCISPERYFGDSTSGTPQRWLG